MGLIYLNKLRLSALWRGRLNFLFNRAELPFQRVRLTGPQCPMNPYHGDTMAPSGSPEKRAQSPVRSASLKILVPVALTLILLILTIALAPSLFVTWHTRKREAAREKG